jgi:hypothetical protein
MTDLRVKTYRYHFLVCNNFLSVLLYFLKSLWHQSTEFLETELL